MKTTVADVVTALRGLTGVNLTRRVEALLLPLTVAQLTEVKRQLGVKASGSTKAVLRAKLVERIAAVLSKPHGPQSLADRIALLQQHEQAGNTPFADWLLHALEGQGAIPVGTDPAKAFKTLQTLAKGQETVSLCLCTEQVAAALVALTAVVPATLTVEELYAVLPKMKYGSARGVRRRSDLPVQVLPANAVAVIEKTLSKPAVEKVRPYRVLPAPKRPPVDLSDLIAA